jgi:hypothetical protein
MNKSHYRMGDLKVPTAIMPFLDRMPRMLPGESEGDYWDLLDLLLLDMMPTTTSEWFVLADVVELCWEIQRYKAWKGAVLAVHHRAAVETALQRVQVSSVNLNPLPVRILMARKEAEEARTDPEKHRIMKAKLAEHGYDDVTLNAGALMEALVPLTTIDRFLVSARSQLNTMLKEVYVRREFAARARKTIDEQLKLEAPKPQRMAA